MPIFGWFLTVSFVRPLFLAAAQLMQPRIPGLSRGVLWCCDPLVHDAFPESGEVIFMLYVDIQHVRKSYDEVFLFEIPQLQISAGQRIGLVGRNGSGKTTLLRLIQGSELPDSGTVRVFGSLTMVQQLASAPDPDEISHGLDKVWRVPKHSGRSGGEQTRAQLARSANERVHVLLLDEPTSNLDMDGIAQLETMILAHEGAVVMISHDQTVLDRVCTHIWDLDDGTLKEYKGNYTKFRQQKDLQVTAQQRDYDNYTVERQRLQNAIVEKKGQSQGMRKTPKRMGNSEARLHKRAIGTKQGKLNQTAKALESRLEQLEAVEKPRDEQGIQFDIHVQEPLASSWALMADGTRGCIDGHQVYDSLRLQLPRAGRLAVIGPNGSGKSTFLRSIEEGVAGLRLPGSARIGFFHQQLDSLEPNATLLESVMQSSPWSETFIRTILARLLFRRDQVHTVTSVLSGGERVKAVMAQLILGRFNMLVLDEPTNYLDIPSIQGLTAVLQAYPGTLIFASHDRSFISQLADHILDFSQRPPKFFQGTWKQWRRPAPTANRDTELLLLRTKAAELSGLLAAATDEQERSALDQQWLKINKSLRDLESPSDFE